MNKYVNDLRPYDSIDFVHFMEDHYKIERLIELLMMAAADSAFHLLAMRGEAAPGSNRAAFLRLGELHLLDHELCKSLAPGAGLRNLLVHEYEVVDYKLPWKSIPQIIKDLYSFMQLLSEQT